MKGKTGLLAVGVVAGFIAAAVYLRIRKAQQADPDTISDQVASNLRELESRLSGVPQLGLIERSA